MGEDATEDVLGELMGVELLEEGDLSDSSLD